MEDLNIGSDGPCDCAEGQCRHFVPEPASCIARLTGKVMICVCLKCEANTWHQDGACLRCKAGR